MPPSPRTRRFAFAREPLVHSLVLGAAIYGLAALVGGSTTPLGSLRIFALAGVALLSAALAAPARAQDQQSLAEVGKKLANPSRRHLWNVPIGLTWRRRPASGRCP